ncbi:MAG TPA: glycosyl hydrolase family 65 protein, partial [Xanthobacteraceae bacterium]|nr:glycosyl hydrolase family 65 protein [Xanthobacteraceae bacterium]
LLSDGLAVDPRLPANWRSLGFRLQWRGRRLTVRIEQSGQILEATLDAGEPMTLVVCGKPHELRRGKTLRTATARRPDGPRAGHPSAMQPIG